MAYGPAPANRGILAHEMGLAPGGLMRQEIYEDEYGFSAWDEVGALPMLRAHPQQPSVP